MLNLPHHNYSRNINRAFIIYNPATCAVRNTVKEPQGQSEITEQYVLLILSEKNFFRLKFTSI